MITKFNHVAIVVPNLDEAAQKYKTILGAKVSESFDYLEHGVSVVFVELDNTKIELMHPYGENSPIKSFLEKNKYKLSKKRPSYDGLFEFVFV